MLRMAVALTLVLPVASAWADEVDPASLYELSTEGSTQKLKSGEKGSLVIAIKSRPGAHVSTEAPLKIELKATGVKPEKEKLTLADSKTQKQPGQQYADPRFEVPFTASAAGKGNVDAKVVFFICTDKLCARQQKNLSVPVEVL